MPSMNIDRIYENKNALFWSLHTLGWVGWGFTHFLAAAVWDGSDSKYAFYVFLISVLGFLFSLPMRPIYRYTWEMDPVRRIVVAVIASYMAATAWYTSRSYIFANWFEKGKEMPPDSSLLDHFLFVFLKVPPAWTVMLAWTGLYFGIKYYRLLQEERQRGLKSETMAHEAQLKMLRYQLNPHFLFNTLNAISTLVLDKQNDLANTMVTRLSHFLRYSLDNDPMAKVTLAQEIEAMKLYLDIEKVRFDERLRLAFEIDKDAEKALIPSLLLQPLVENAIKYAIAQSVNGGAIRIAARVFAGQLLLEVADDGPGLDPNVVCKNKRTGVGLANTRERLKELYGENHGFQLGKTDPHGLTINIRIPLEIAEPEA